RCRCGHGLAVATHIGVTDQRNYTERIWRAISSLWAEMNRHPCLVVDIPIRWVGGIDRYWSALAAEYLRPVRRRSSSTFHARGSIRAEPRHHGVRRGDHLRHAHHFCERTESAIQVLEVRSVSRSACLPGLADGIHRAPHAAIVADKYL